MKVKVSRWDWFYYSFRIHWQESSAAVEREEIGARHLKNGMRMSRENLVTLLCLHISGRLCSQGHVSLWLGGFPSYHSPSPAASGGHLFTLALPLLPQLPAHPRLHPTGKVVKNLSGLVVGVSCSSHHPFRRVWEWPGFCRSGSWVCIRERGGFSLSLYQPGLSAAGQGVGEHSAFWEYAALPTAPSSSVLPLQKSLFSWGLCLLLRHSFSDVTHLLSPVPCSHLQEYSWVWLSLPPDKETHLILDSSNHRLHATPCQWQGSILEHSSVVSVL